MCVLVCVRGVGRGGGGGIDRLVGTQWQLTTFILNEPKRKGHRAGGGGGDMSKPCWDPTTMHYSKFKYVYNKL